MDHSERLALESKVRNIEAEMEQQQEAHRNTIRVNMLSSSLGFFSPLPDCRFPLVFFFLRSMYRQVPPSPIIDKIANTIHVFLVQKVKSLEFTHQTHAEALEAEGKALRENEAEGHAQQKTNLLNTKQRLMEELKSVVPRWEFFLYSSPPGTGRG